MGTVVNIALLSCCRLYNPLENLARLIFYVALFFFTYFKGFLTMIQNKSL